MNRRWRDNPVRSYFGDHQKYLLIEALALPVSEEGAKAKRIWSLNRLFNWMERMSKEVGQGKSAL
ncbi:MAG: hypothetical protein QOI53_310 [Verrucomicrobiota bacterium]|jgi:hypothetical protein|nr:hypothetical protein [Verrucomicrobiota bacterium]